MNRISILDCTLRDGGYINRWHFGHEAIRDIIALLTEAHVEIIECGFLRDVPYDRDTAVFSDVEQIVPFISPKKPGTMYVGMIALGDIDPNSIRPNDGTSIDGIRLTFHRHEWEEARAAAVVLMDKGYKVFIQPVGTTSYTDGELLKLIEDVNVLCPSGFYMVDTLGIMYRRDVVRMFNLIDNNLNPDLTIGFHSHNNLQLSFANAQEVILQDTRRSIMIDASVYGMGRGAGNLPAELIAEYINSNLEQRYTLLPLLNIADQYLMSVFAEHPWGYALPYFLSSKEHCHPNYTAYLMNRQTLGIEAISKVLNILPLEQRDLYHPELAEQCYNTFQNCQIDDSEACAALREMIAGREVMMIGPGASVKTAADDLLALIEKDRPIKISVNFVPDVLPIDALFVSNQKRITALRPRLGEVPCVIATSNLLRELPDSVHFINYTDYLEDGDNAGAMLIRLLKKTGVSKILLAGFDGFTTDSGTNYCVPSYKRMLTEHEARQKNTDISRQLLSALGSTPHRMLTPTRYDI